MKKLGNTFNETTWETDDFEYYTFVLNLKRFSKIYQIYLLEVLDRGTHLSLN